MKLTGFFYIFMACLMLTGILMAAPDDLLTVENKFIKIFINNSPEEMGRFAVDVTKGDPERADDDSKPLIYGHPKPWTSFTTIRINNQNYVFGKATTKRSGAGIPGGEIITPPQLVNNRLMMKCKYDVVTVEQVLDITYSPSTGAPDTTRIRYVVRNEGTTPVEVGIRTLLDTMVGDNDGAPFRAGNQEITYEYGLNGSEAPDFWQAFDSISKPAVIAQGTLRGGDVTTPDRIIFTNWGKAADQPWDFPVQSGTSFLRLGENELDSAVVMYWEPKVIKPGEQDDIVIYYGLGGITFSPGRTYLGISAPAEVRYSIDQPQNYTVVMYMEHRGETMAKNVKIKLTLPEGLDLISGQAAITLPELLPGITRQISWLIRPNGQSQGEASFHIRVTGEGLEANQVSRKLRIIGPPAVKAKLSVPMLKVLNNGWSPYPVPVSVNLTNTGDSAASDLKIHLNTDDGLKLADGESSIKFLDQLKPGEQGALNWRVVPVSGNKNSQLKVEISGTGIKPLSLSGEITIPPLPSKLMIEPMGKFTAGLPVCMNVVAYNLRNVKEFYCDIGYDPQKLRLVYISRGNSLVEGDTFSKWDPGKADRQNGIVTGIRGSREQLDSGGASTLFTLNFMAVEPGEGQIQCNLVVIKDSSGRDLQFDIIPIQYRIEEGKK
jgi:hypothetical protein